MNRCSESPRVLSGASLGRASDPMMSMVKMPPPGCTLAKAALSSGALGSAGSFDTGRATNGGAANGARPLGWNRFLTFFDALAGMVFLAVTLGVFLVEPFLVGAFLAVFFVAVAAWARPAVGATSSAALNTTAIPNLGQALRAGMATPRLLRESIMLDLREIEGRRSVPTTRTQAPPTPQRCCALRGTPVPALSNPTPMSQCLRPHAQ